MAKVKARLTELEALLSTKEEELQSTRHALTKAEASRAKLKQYLEAFREQAVNTTNIIAQYQELQKQHSDLQQQHALLQQQKQGQDSCAKPAQQQPGGQEERLVALQRAHEQLQGEHTRCLKELRDLRQRQQEGAASGTQQLKQVLGAKSVLYPQEAQELRELRRTVQELQVQLQAQQRRQGGVTFAGQDGAEGVSESTHEQPTAKQLQQSSAVPQRRVAERGPTPTAAAGRPADSVVDWQRQEGAGGQQQDRERRQQEAAARQEAERRLAEALAELGVVRRAEAATRKEMEELKAQVHQLQALVGQHASALSRLGEAAARHDEALARHSADGLERSAALQRHEAALTQQGAAVARHEQQLAGQAAALQDQGGRLSGLAAAVEGLQPRLLQLEGQAGGVEGKLATLGGQVHGMLRTHSILRRAFGAAGEVEDAGLGPVGLGERLPAGGEQQPALALPAPQALQHRWENGEHRQRGVGAMQHAMPPAVSPPRNGTQSDPLGDQVAALCLDSPAHVRQELAPPAPGTSGKQHPPPDTSQHRNKRRRLAAEQPGAGGPVAPAPADPPAAGPSPPTTSPLLPLLPGPPPTQQQTQSAPRSPQARPAVQSPASAEGSAVSWQQRLFHSDVGQALSQPPPLAHQAVVQGTVGDPPPGPKRGPGRPRKAVDPAECLSTLLSTRLAHPSQLHRMATAAARRIGDALQARMLQPGAAAAVVCDAVLRCCKPAVGPDQQGEGQARRAGGKAVAGDTALQHAGEAAEGGAAADGLEVQEGLPEQGPGGRRRGGREEGVAGGKSRQREAGTGGGLADELSALWCSPLPRRQQLVNLLVECVWCADVVAGPSRGLDLSSSRAHGEEAVPPAGVQHSQGKDGQPVEQQRQQTRSLHGPAGRAGGWRLGSSVARQLHAHLCVGDVTGRVTASGARAGVAGGPPKPAHSPAGASLSERCAAAHALGELCKRYRDGGAFRTVLLDLLHTAAAGGQAAGGAAGPPHPHSAPSSAPAAPTPAEDSAQRPAARAPSAATAGSLLPLACLVAAWPAGLSVALPATASPAASPAQAAPSGDAHAPPPLPASGTAHDAISGRRVSPSWPPTRELQLVADPVAVAAQMAAQALALIRLQHVAGSGRQGHGPAQAGGGLAPSNAACVGPAGRPDPAVEASAATALMRAAVEMAGAHALPGAKSVVQAASGQEPLVPLCQRALHEAHRHVEELVARLLGLLWAACCHVLAPADRQQDAPQPGCLAASPPQNAPMLPGSGSPTLGGYCQALLLVCHVLPPAAVYDRVLRVLANWLLDAGAQGHQEGESKGQGRRVRERGVEVGSRMYAATGRPGERDGATEGDDNGGGAPEVAWSAAGSQDGGSSDPESEAADSGQAGRGAGDRRAAACSEPPRAASSADGGDPSAPKLSSAGAGVVLQLLVDVAAQSLCSCDSENTAWRAYARSEGGLASPPAAQGPGDSTAQEAATELVAGVVGPQLHGSGNATMAPYAGTDVRRESTRGNREGLGGRGVRVQAADQDGQMALPGVMVLRQGVLSLCGLLCRRLLPAACAAGQPWGQTVAAAVAELAALSCVGQEGAELDAGEAGAALVLLRKHIEEKSARVLELVDMHLLKCQ